MRFYADLHIHSKYSMACSRDCDLEHLAWWAGRKGIAVVGTGDFTHPGWIQELRSGLVPAEPGLFRLRPEQEAAVLARLPTACRTPVRFLLSSEISTIYKRDDRTRKVHHLLYAPDFESVAEITRRLARIGNLASDGRPILGLDSRDLLEITLESGEGNYLVPAHIWTPWFAALGSKSGFDAIADCYADLADHIVALETGLSSDPAMNRRFSGLDQYRLVSNSDAHSPPMLGREATMFDSDLDYEAIRRSLHGDGGLAGTVEFFPEEGKYHLDGHRSCGVRTIPAETRRFDGRCPVCEKPLTVGVLHRVEALADRDDGPATRSLDTYACLVPLAEVLGEIAGVGPKTKTVSRQLDILAGRLGPELPILQDLPLDAVAEVAPPVLVEALRRLRQGSVGREPGYDGVYGRIQIFRPDELDALQGSSALFDLGRAKPRERRGEPVPVPSEGPADRPGTKRSRRSRTVARRGDLVTQRDLLDRLDAEQRAAATVPAGPALVVAGPGTGKTRVLTHRLAWRVRSAGIDARSCLALTFSRRARDELRSRLRDLVPDEADALLATTFHGLGLQVIREQHDRLQLPADVGVADEVTRSAMLSELAAGSSRRHGEQISAFKRQRAISMFGAQQLTLPSDEETEVAELAERYDHALAQAGLVDFDDLLILPVGLLAGDDELRAHYRGCWSEVAVDEYQDIDELQYRLLRYLCPPGGSLFAIGDPDQAIYSFRGADVGYFLRFQEDFPSAKVVKLAKNYRSTPTIVRASLAAIAPTSLVAGRRLVPVRHDLPDEPIIIERAADVNEEAALVVSLIEKLLGGTSFGALDQGRADSRSAHELSFSDFAVLYRTTEQAGPIAGALAARGFPHRIRSHERWTDRPEVQAILGHLGAADEGTTVLARWQEAARAVLDDFERPEPPTFPREAIGVAAEQLAPLAADCGQDVERFVAELTLGVEVDLWDPRADRVSLLTLHAAKGLEFPVVFLAGCDDGLLPLRPWSGTSTGVDDAEERRLLFVGMTRATTQLVVTGVRRRQRWGAVRDTAPSPFLASIPTELTLQDAYAFRGVRRPPPARQLRLL